MSSDAPIVVVALIGLPGAGKSSIARALEQRLGLQRICRDAIRAAMFPDCRYTPAERRAAFRALLSALQVNCLLGRSSVLDGMTFSRHADLRAVDAAVARHDVHCLPIHVDCPAALARERIATDTLPHPAADRSPQLVDQVLARFDPPPSGCAVIDGRQPREQVIDAAVSLVAAVLGR